MNVFEDFHAIRLAFEAIAKQLEALNVAATSIAADLKALTDASTGRPVGIVVKPGEPTPH